MWKGGSWVIIIIFIFKQTLRNLACVVTARFGVFLTRRSVSRFYARFKNRSTFTFAIQIQVRSQHWPWRVQFEWHRKDQKWTRDGINVWNCSCKRFGDCYLWRWRSAVTLCLWLICSFLRRLLILINLLPLTAIYRKKDVLSHQSKWGLQSSFYLFILLFFHLLLGFFKSYTNTLLSSSTPSSLCSSRCRGNCR